MIRLSKGHTNRSQSVYPGLLIRLMEGKIDWKHSMDQIVIDVGYGGYSEINKLAQNRAAWSAASNR